MAKKIPRTLGQILFLMALWHFAGTPFVAAQQIDLAIVAAKPFVDAWRMCAMEKGSQYARTTESAETVASTALAACGEEKPLVWGALFQSKASAHLIQGDVAYLEKIIRQQIMITILEAKLCSCKKNCGEENERRPSKGAKDVAPHLSGKN
jgi:hypothetical protein